MRPVIFFYLFTTLSFSCVSQVNTQPFVNITRISFLDKDLQKRFQENTNQVENKWKVPNINDGFNNLTTKYNEINSKWISVSNFNGNSRNLVIDVTKQVPIFFNTKSTPQLLNDTLLLLEDGKLKNLQTGEYVIRKSGIDKVPIQVSGLKQFKSSNQILMTDIFYTTFQDCEPNKFIFNLLNDSVFVSSEKSLFQGQIINNSTSKYLLFSQKYNSGKPGLFYWNLNLMNRFNVLDRKDIPSLLVDTYEMGKPPVIYNDSIVYLGIKVNSSYKLLNLEYNKVNNYLLNENLLYPFDISKFYPNIDLNDHGKYEFINANSTSYFFKKYNKLDISKSTIEQLGNYYNIYKNILGYDPNLIIEYNYKSQTIISIIDRPVLPLKSINSMFLDKMSRFLIVQQLDNDFTIFDLKNKREIITLKGYVNGVNSKNELLVNVIGEYNRFNLSRVSLIKLNLNELLQIDENSYPKEIDENLSLDEFTTKENFKSKISKFTNTYGLHLKSNPPVSQSQLSVINSPSNDFILYTLNSNVSKYFSKVNSTENQNELVFNLKYISYSIENKYIEFITEDLTDKNLSIFESFTHQNIQVIKPYPSKNYVVIRFTNLSPESAKILKDQKFQIVIKNSQLSELEFPNYNNIFVFNHFELIKQKFYYKNDPELDQSKRFYNYFVPIVKYSENYFNSYFIRSESGDQFIVTRDRKL